MDDQRTDVGSTRVPGAPVEGWMLREDIVREVRRPRTPRVYAKAIDAHRPFLKRRGPEVGWNGVVLLRELRLRNSATRWE